MQAAFKESVTWVNSLWEVAAPTIYSHQNVKETGSQKETEIVCSKVSTERIVSHTVKEDISR